MVSQRNSPVEGILNNFPVESVSKNSLITGCLKEVNQYFSFLGHTPERSEGTIENLLLKINNLCTYVPEQ